MVAATSLFLGACADDAEQEGLDATPDTDAEVPDDGPDDEVGEGAEGPDPDDPPPEAPTGADDPEATEQPDPDDGADEGSDGDGPETGASDGDAGADEDAEDEGAPPLSGDPSAATTSDDGEFGPDLVVTDVRVAGHDGFDRLVLELDGDGLAGWFVGYADEAVAQGSGHPIEPDGEAVLEVAASNVTLPPELPDHVEPWSDDPVAGPEDGVIVEVVDDSIFEGLHRVVVGTTSEQPFLVDRLDDPQRIVIDVFHD